MTTEIDKNQIPNFYILGAAKSGTTSLYKYLSQHPKIYFPENKEPQFFCCDELYKKGLKSYLSNHYRNSESYPLRGDASPQYIYYEKAASRIKEVSLGLPSKFIVILRDPVERAYSLYKNMCYEGYEKLSFKEALEAESKRLSDKKIFESGSLRFAYLDSGYYAKQLNIYIRCFGIENIHITFYQDLIEHPEEVVKDIYEFLGVENIPLTISEIYNSAGVPRFASLQAALRRPSRLRNALGRLLPQWFKYRFVVFLLSLNKKKASYKPMDRSVEKLLRKKFLQDIKELEKITNRRLSEWTNEDSKVNSLG